MIKYLFILVNWFTFFIYSLFIGDNPITVSSNIPKSIAPGTEVPVELKVAKGTMSGFAKLQLDLPSGISVKEIDSKGSSFTFDEGIAKWVWSSLPMDEELIVKCYLVAASDATGIKTIGGKYSYVENNAKKVIEMSPVEVQMGEAVAGEPLKPVSDTPTTAAVPANTETPVQNTVVANTNTEPNGEITATRTITKGLTEGEYMVEVQINKGITKGFARYSDDLPADITASAGKTQGSSFSVSDGKLKFVWVNVPDNDVLEISYTLSGVKQSYTLNGEYSYLEQNQSKMVNLKAETITVVPANAVALTPTESPVPTETTAPTATETAVPTTTVTATPTETVAGTVTEPKTTQPDEALPKKDSNVNFMVQIGAFANAKVKAASLEKKFKISEKINSEFQGGFSKFMVGSHEEYKNARDHREKIRTSNGITRAFVVAYNTGRRITVQEALMITNQKWYK